MKFKFNFQKHGPLLIIPAIVLGLFALNILFPNNSSITNDITQFQQNYEHEVYQQGYQSGYNAGYSAGYKSGYNYSQSQAFRNFKNYIGNFSRNSNVKILHSSYTIHYLPVKRSFNNFTLNNAPVSILNSSSYTTNLTAYLTINYCLYNITCQTFPVNKSFTDVVNFVLIQTSNTTILNNSGFTNYFSNSTTYYPVMFDQNSIIPIYFPNFSSTNIYLLVFFDSMIIQK